ncbi:MAG: C40 family peptidase [Ruminococcaceae bacterium]|nr:C40 family peptidase [Oscillospiraceae bacterium]MBD5117307.1 C40 family peptidase [Oscillospiraceae bacterium]
MKKTIDIIALLLSLALMLSACGKVDDENENTQDSGVISEVSDTSGSDTVDTEITGEKTDVITVSEANTETSIITEATEQTTEDDPINTENQVVQTAEALIGIPFAENGASPSEGFDNSGFIYYVLRENGFITCPRLTQDQAAMGTHIGYDELKSGDLAFFCTADSGNPDFGGIYIGEGQMIYSPMPGQTVKIADISSDYWKGTFVTGVSLS